ncbi:MAG: glycosyltransferase family 2 protein, partial [Candidatus Nanoarchaeia archaeon]
MKPETVVLIPNFNGEHHLRECLNSLLAQTYKRYKIILIDNGSADGSVNYVKENFSEVEIIKLDKNYGFSFSVNKGIFYSMVNYKPEYIVVLNNDTRVDKGWLHYLVKSIKSDEKIVSVASNMLFYDNPSVINSHG